MALSPRYQSRLEALVEAMKDFTFALAEDLSKFSPRQQDLLRNGQVQKFEFCIELLWKVMKAYLYEKRGVDEVAPKSVIKAFYQTEALSAETFEKLVAMIDDRNILSHVYSEIEFLDIHGRLFDHIKTMQKATDLLVKNV